MKSLTGRSKNDYLNFKTLFTKEVKTKFIQVHLSEEVMFSQLGHMPVQWLRYFDFTLLINTLHQQITLIDLATTYHYAEITLYLIYIWLIITYR